MIGTEGLHQHAAALSPAAGAARHLRHQVKRPFGGAEVGQVQGRVGIDHADQRHVGKVEPLGDHLRAQQDVHLARAKRGQRLLVAAAACIVSVSIRRQGTSGNRAWTSASSRCVPSPL